eukprot:3835191-Pyramimonas_sp.AAC.1
MLSCADAVEAAGDVDAGPVRGGHPHRGVVRVTARREHRPSDGEGPDLPSERGRRQGYGGRNAESGLWGVECTLAVIGTGGAVK